MDAKAFHARLDEYYAAGDIPGAYDFLCREKAAAAAMKYHTVRKGDTLSKIAVQYHTSVNTLCRLNGIKQTTTLQIGRKLRVR